MEKNLYEVLSGAFQQPLPFELKAVVSDRMNHHFFPKGDIILRPGQTNDRLYFIQKGLLRAYSIEDGVEVSGWIKAEGEFVVSISSFYPQLPSTQYIHAIEDTQAWSILHRELFDIYRRHLEFSYIGLVLTIPVLVEWDERLHTLQTMNSMQRFEWFMQRHSNLIYRTPGVQNKYIASYLGMTPETFSKVKREYFKLSDNETTLKKRAS
jgi:CRP/FNR family transcriptional regulator, anaerobic regulatory protein